MSTSAAIHAKFFPPTLPIVRADPALWRVKRKPKPRRRLGLELAVIPPRIARATEIAARIDRIMAVACVMYGTTMTELMGPRRCALLGAARMYAAVRLSRELGLPSTRIGQIIGRDHSTIISMFRRAEGVAVTYLNGIAKRRKGKA